MADLQSMEHAAPSNGGGAAAGKKRQRRPSVRLGDIGAAVHHDSHLRRSKQLKIPPHQLQLDPFHGDQSRSIWTERSISRTNWTDTPDFKPNEDDAADEGYRDSEDREDLSTLLKEDSRERNSNQKEADTRLDFGFWSNPRLRSLEDGSVRAWLNGLGLGRYLPVFQIHEVDDEVLPFLTLEDLKEMGITAVGSRRKIFYAIQKLGKREKQLVEGDPRSSTQRIEGRGALEGRTPPFW